MTPFERDITDGLSVDGFFLRPPESRRNSKDIYILVNKRWIRHYGLARAIGDVFQGILPPRVYPLAVVNVHVDPQKVDVNAHPTKEEVRFEQDGILIAGVKHAFRDALEQMALMPTAVSLSPTAPAGDAVDEARQRSAAPLQGRQDPERQASLDLPSSLGRTKAENGWSNFDFAAARERLRGAGDAMRDKPHSGFEPLDEIANRPDPAPVHPAQQEQPDRSAEVRLGPAGQHRLLGQASGKYLLVDGPDGILLVDPHALHERQNYDRLVAERGKGSPQRLLIPLELDLSPAEASAAAEAMPGLAENGFKAELSGANRLVVTAAPSFIAPSRLETVLRHCLADVAEAGETLANARDKVLASLACHSSVLLGRTLPEEEVVALLDRFFNQGQLPTCPHGRPTAIRITWEELAQRFGR